MSAAANPVRRASCRDEAHSTVRGPPTKCFGNFYHGLNGSVNSLCFCHICQESYILRQGGAGYVAGCAAPRTANNHADTMSQPGQDRRIEGEG
jgi:hypothetical protein